MSATTVERRKTDRQKIRLLVGSNLLVGLTAIGALILVVISFLRFPGQQAALRARAAEDTCYLLRGLVLSATPPSESSRAKTYIDSTPLRNCHTYGQKLATHP
jgi:hypothetical protein